MTILYYITPLVQVLCLQLSSLTIIYFILGVRSGSLTILVPMSTNCRPPLHQSILCILHFSPFLTKCILLAICMVCFVSLPFLAMHIADLLSKTIKGASFGTMSGSSSFFLCFVSYLTVSCLSFFRINWCPNVYNGIKYGSKRCNLFFANGRGAY